MKAEKRRPDMLKEDRESIREYREIEREAIDMFRKEVKNIEKLRRRMKSLVSAEEMERFDRNVSNLKETLEKCIKDWNGGLSRGAE